MTSLRHDDAPIGGSELPERGSSGHTERPHVGPAGMPNLPSDSMPVSESFAWLWQQANQQIDQLKEDLKRERQRYQALIQRKTQLDSELASIRQILAANRNELEIERSSRIAAERELSSVLAGWQHVQNELNKLENERTTRIKIERRLALLDTQSDKALELAGQLAKERNLRLKLEREKGMLLNELRPRQELEGRIKGLVARNNELQEKYQEADRRAAKFDLALLHVGRLEKLLADEKTTRLSSDVRASAAVAKAARLEGELKASRRRRRTATPPARHWLWRAIFG